MKLKFTGASAITRNPKLHYHVDKNPSPAPNLRQTISVYISVIFIWIILLPEIQQIGEHLYQQSQLSFST